MNWINIHTETLRGEAFIDSEPIERSTWLSLLGWSCAQENDGEVVDCFDWKDRKWQQLCGVTRKEVHLDSELYGFDGKNLIVNFYPIEQQAAVKAKRKAGKKGGRPKKETTSSPLRNKEEKPHGLADGNHKVKDTLNEKESKGKESKSKVIKIVSDETRETLLALWNNSPRQSRNRSSKKKVADAWKNLKSKPTKNELLDAMDAWRRCEDWKKDQGSFIQGLHIWLKDEKWQDLPEHGTATNQSIMGW